MSLIWYKIERYLRFNKVYAINCLSSERFIDYSLCCCFWCFASFFMDRKTRRVTYIFIENKIVASISSNVENMQCNWIFCALTESLSKYNIYYLNTTLALISYSSIQYHTHTLNFLLYANRKHIFKKMFSQIWNMNDSYRPWCFLINKSQYGLFWSQYFIEIPANIYFGSRFEPSSQLI